MPRETVEPVTEPRNIPGAEMPPFQQGKEAARAGQERSANPGIIGQTKLGNPKLSEDGVEWDNGWLAGQPPVYASARQIEAAAEVDVSRFKRKSNRFYK